MKNKVKAKGGLNEGEEPKYRRTTKPQPKPTTQPNPPAKPKEPKK